MPIAITTDFGATRDEVLIRRITAGETHLFPKLVEPYVRAASAAVHAVLEQRADAEDAMQQAIKNENLRSCKRISEELLQPGS